MWIIYMMTLMCVTDACPSGRFGDGCRYKCYCLNGCHDETGLCYDPTCIIGWYGPQCKHENLITSVNDSRVTVAPDQPYFYMIDDNDETCIDIGEINQINITFETPVFFTYVRLLGETGLHVNLALSIMSNEEPPPVCTVYSKRITGSNIVDYVCNPNGNVTGISLNIMALKKICSLYVSRACDHGKTGNTCQFDCKKCHLQDCSFHDGRCTLGCDGYRNFPLCDEKCLMGFYGVNCSLKCNEGCFENSCDHLTGMCTEGCFGFQDPEECTLPCNGTFGFNCLCESSCKQCEPKSDECLICNDEFKLDTELKTCKPIPEKKQEAAAETEIVGLNAKIAIVSLLFFQIALGAFLCHRKYRKRPHHEDE